MDAQYEVDVAGIRGSSKHKVQQTTCGWGGQYDRACQRCESTVSMLIEFALACQRALVVRNLSPGNVGYLRSVI